MTSEKNIEEKLEKLAQAISPDETLIENVMSRINAMPIAGPSIGPAQNIWGTIMKSPITKLAAAAVIIIACSIGLMLWISTGSGIALADVLAKLEQVATYKFQTRSILTRQRGNEERLSTVLISQDHGVKITLKTIDPNNGESPPSDTYVLPQQNCILFLMHENKMYVRVKFNDDTELEQHKGENNDPRVIVKKLLKHNYVRLGQSVIDGTTVEGFQTTDPNYDGGFMTMSDMMGKNEKVNIKLWVDVKTSLPVRLEEDIVKDHGMRFHEVSDDFRWNVIINADDFNPVIPEGYTSPVGEIAIPIFNEETAIIGLRVFADILNTYPVNLIGNNPTEEYRLFTGYDKNSWEELPENEKNRRMNDIKMPIFGLGMFYEKLVEDKKDPAYYGETVGPNDSNKVLLRWKLGDDQYRVIFGDLHADTVTSDGMKELETPLQK
jgi:outer membrane lipoprotein-sorting protein